MKQNIGSIDRGIRLVLAVAIGLLIFTDQLSGTLALILGIIAVAFLVTGLTGFCILYLPFKFSTKKQAS